MRSITWYRGTEMELGFGGEVALLRLQSPWQRRANEHTTDSLRVYFPKGVSSPITDRRR